MVKLKCPECNEQITDEMIDVNMCFLCGCIIDKSLFDNTLNYDEENNDEIDNSACNSDNERDLEDCDDKSINVEGLKLKRREIEGERILECLRCNSKMSYLKTDKIQLGQTSYFLRDWSNLIAGSIQLEIYSCTNCGKVEFFLPPEQTEYEEDRIAQRRCPGCGNLHDIDYPKCPFCKFVYSED